MPDRTPAVAKRRHPPGRRKRFPAPLRRWPASLAARTGCAHPAGPAAGAIAVRREDLCR